jgi:AcrR family transcriptional regulator
MTAMAEVALKQTARDRLLAAANELFYDEGIQTVGIDRIIEHAGVAKASLYSTFGSKDELIRAYLESRAQGRRDAIERALAEAHTPRARLLSVFDVLETMFRRPGFHGCAFVNASAEARPGSAAEQASAVYREWARDLFLRLATEADAPRPAELARQLHLLYDGALISARMDRDPGIANLARATASMLIDAALPAEVPAPR